MDTTLTAVVVAPERAGESEQVRDGALEFAHRQAGFHAMRLLRDIAQPGHYVVLSEWESRDDFDRFVRTSGLYWLNRALEQWQALPTVAYEEVLASTDTAEGG